MAEIKSGVRRRRPASLTLTQILHVMGYKCTTQDDGTLKIYDKDTGQFRYAGTPDEIEEWIDKP